MDLILNPYYTEIDLTNKNLVDKDMIIISEFLKNNKILKNWKYWD